MLNVSLDKKTGHFGNALPDNLLTSTEEKVKNQEKQNTKPRLT